MIAVVGFVLLGMFLWQSADPPDIAGRWTGEEWGNVLLEQKQPGSYEGTYTNSDIAKSGDLHLKWSRFQRRFNGTWRDTEGDRNGKMSLRLVDNDIRGAWTTSKKAAIQPAMPRLADLLWVRLEQVASYTADVPPHFGSAEAVLKYQEQCIQERNYFGYYDCLTQDELNRLSGLVLHVLSSVTTIFQTTQRFQPSVIEATSEEELAKIERVKALLKRSKLAFAPRDAVDAHDRLVATKFAPLRGDKSRENPENFSHLLSKASGMLKDRRQFLVEVVIACPEFFELLIVGGESPEWQVVVESDRATATTSADQDNSTQIELRQLDGQWRISQVWSDDVIRAHISGASMFGEEYAAATTEQTQRTETDPGAVESLPSTIDEGREPTSLITDFHRQLAGRWQLRTCEEHGELFTIEQLKKGDIPEGTTESKKVIEGWKEFAVAVFDDKTFSFGSDPHQIAGRFDYSVEYESDPQRIRLSMDATPRAVNREAEPQRVTLLGLIRVSRDQLIIALAGYGDDFPKDFQSEGKDVLVLRYERDRGAQVGPDAGDRSNATDAGEEAMANESVKKEERGPGTVESLPFHWPARLSGIVTGLNGTGIAGAEVRLTVTEHFRKGTDYGERTLKTAQTTADDTGKYTFNAADWPIPSAERPFSIMVLASAPEHAPWEMWHFSRAGKRKAPDWFSEVKLPRGKEITGRCIDASGKPVFRAIILGQSAFDQPGRWQRRHSPTDLDGRFRVMVPDGHAAALWIVSDSEGNERVDIPATHDGPLQVKMRGGTSLVGRVESLAGEPVAGTLVVLQVTDRGVRDGWAMVMRFAAETDEQGQFRMPPARGEFRCFLAQAFMSDERATGESIFAERAAPPLAPVTVSLDGKSRRKEISLRESRTVRLGGAMQLEDGRPVEGCIIKVSCGGVSMGTPVSDKDGRYSITVPAMQQELSISALGARNYHVRRAQHSPGEPQDNYFINLKGVTEDITNADFVFISQGENVERPAEGSGSVLFWQLVEASR